MKNSSRFLRTALIACVFGGVAACAGPQSGYMDEPTEIANKKYTIKKDYTVVNLPTYKDNSVIHEKLAASYKMRGAGDLYIAMAVDASMPPEQRQAISQKAQHIAARFNDMGVDRTRVAVMEVIKANPNLSVIGFETRELGMVTECKNETIPGYGATRVDMEGYRLGCHQAAMIKRQVADERDLMGTQGLGGKNDARRASNVVDNYYRPGETQEYLPGFIVSELGGSGE